MALFLVVRILGENLVLQLKVLQGDDEWSSNWRNNIISIVTKGHVVYKALTEKRIMKKKFHL